MSKKKIILIAATVLVVTAILTGYMLWNKPHKDVKGADGLRIAATELYTRYMSDSAMATLLYTDKVLLVTGEVARLALNQQDQEIVLIKTTVSGAYINCTMEEKTKALKEGDQVTIKGICSGYINGDADMGLPGDVFLVRGYSFTK